MVIFDYGCSSIPSTSSALHVSVIPLAGVHPRQRGVSRDIKPQYLLLNPETGILKLCDFASLEAGSSIDVPVASYLCHS